VVVFDWSRDNSQSAGWRTIGGRKTLSNFEGGSKWFVVLSGGGCGVV